jgi:hypothetical protein
MSSAQPSKALYYPHLEFGSVEWVKGALLYWDALVRPINVAQPHDEGEIQEMVEAGLIESVHQKGYADHPDREHLVQDFGERLEDLLHEHGGIPESVPRAPPLRGRLPELIARDVDVVIDDLRARGRTLAADAVRAQRAQAITLMVTVWISEMAHRLGLAMVTDDPIFDGIETYFRTARVMVDPAGLSSALAAAQLVVPTPCAESLKSLPVDRLVELRRKLAPARRSYRRKIEERTEAIAGLDDVEAVREHMKNLAEELRDDLEAQRDIIRGAKLKDAWSFLGVRAPASVAVGVTLAESAAPVLAPVAGIGAVALSVSSWFLQRRKDQQPTGGHYMYSLQRALGSDGKPLEDGLNQLLRKAG